MKDLHLLSSYQFDLPADLIAQQPVEPRDSSRLMVIDRKTGRIENRHFNDIVEYLQSGDDLVFNDTKVIPARLLGKRETGGQAEIFLTKRRSDSVWEALAQPGKRMRNGSKVIFNDTFYAEILDTHPDGSKVIQLFSSEDIPSAIQKHGQMPLPQYIRREASNNDQTRYQTVYAAKPGAVAAPTAGLHFTPQLLQNLSEKGVTQTHVTLHVGQGTFKPVQVEDIRQHQIHSEWMQITPEIAAKLNHRARNQICVGTTSCRTLESAASSEGLILPGEYETNIFIYPGYRFKYVKSLLTNFHLPGSTLLMLVSAFAGYDLTMEAYRKAVEDRYRFFSYGDAMLIL